jgi:hypothetical protein
MFGVNFQATSVDGKKWKHTNNWRDWCDITFDHKAGGYIVVAKQGWIRTSNVDGTKSKQFRLVDDSGTAISTNYYAVCMLP